MSATITTAITTRDGMEIQSNEVPDTSVGHVQSTPSNDKHTNILASCTERAKGKRNCIKHASIPKDTEITPMKYFRENIDLRSYKFQELRSVYQFLNIKHFNTFLRIFVPKSKQSLIEQIDSYCNKWMNAIIIQKVMRGHFVRHVHSIYLHGEAWNQRSLCVNETDVYTMEPLSEIPNILFFSYKTKSNHFYGFDVNSLIIMYRKGCNTFINPYNRETFHIDDKKRIFQLYHLIRIIFPDYVMENDVYTPLPKVRRLPNSITQSVRRQAPSHNIQTTRTSQNFTTFRINQNQYVLSNYQLSTINFIGRTNNQYMENIEEIIIQLLQRQRMLGERSNQTNNSRIQNIFMSIDQLGNYTDSFWFLELTHRELRRFYQLLFEIWHGRAHIPIDTKHRICPVEDPFLNIPIGDEQDIEYIRNICLIAMERIILSSFDQELQKIGAMHVLTALTVVSPGARNSLIWLYESMF